MILQSLKLELDATLKFLSFLYIILSGLGYISIHLYYSEYHINIIEYLDIGEIFSLFLPIAYYLGIPVAILFVIGYPFYKASVWLRELGTPKTLHIVILLISLFFSLCVLYCFNLLPVRQRWCLVLLEHILFVYWYFSQYGRWRIRSILKKNVVWPLILLGGIVTHFFLVPLIDNNNEGYKVNFRYNDKEIISSNERFPFIGKTNNYIFLRDTEKNSILIYEISNITEMEVVRKLFPDKSCSCNL